MAPKRQCSKVTIMKAVKPSSDTNLRKRKKPDSQEQTSGKRQRQNSPKDQAMRLIKGKNVCPLQAEVIQHIESCINTAVLSVLGRKKVADFELVQVHLSRLKQRLLQLCKNMKLPATNLGKLSNLAKDLQEEQRRMEKYEDTLQSLNREIEDVVETTEKIEESTVSLESKIETLKQQAQETFPSLDQILSNKDPLQLPQATFEAPTMQDQAKKLNNPKLILKELTKVQSNPIYKNVRNLVQMSYAEIDTL